MNKITEEAKVHQEELRTLKDPNKIKEVTTQIFYNFLNNLQTFDVYNPLPKHDNIKYVTIIGETSAGKSSIYNTYFGLNLKTGQAECTMDIQQELFDQQNNRVYWDSPGFNEEIEVYNAELLKAFY